MRSSAPEMVNILRNANSKQRTWIIIALVAVLALVAYIAHGKLSHGDHESFVQAVNLIQPGQHRFKTRGTNPMGIVVTMDNKHLLVGTHEYIEIYTLPDLEFVKARPHTFTTGPCLSVSPDGTKLAAGMNGKMNLYDLKKVVDKNWNEPMTKAEVWTYSIYPPALMGVISGSTFFSAFSPDGTTLVGAHENSANKPDNTHWIYVLDVATGKLKGSIRTGIGSTVGIKFLTPTIIAYAKEVDKYAQQAPGSSVQSWQGSVQVADITTFQRVRSVGVGIQPVRLDHLPGAPNVYVSVRGRTQPPYKGQIAVVPAEHLIHGTGPSIARIIPNMGPSTVGVGISLASGPKLVVAASNRWVKNSKGSIYIVDPASGKILKTLDGDGFPREVIVNQHDSNVVFVGNFWGNSIDVLNLSIL